MPSGSLSPYGGEVHALLKYLAQPEQQTAISSKAPVDGPSWQRALAAYFKDYYKGYKNHSIKTLIATLDAGKQDPAGGDEQDTQANSHVQGGGGSSCTQHCCCLQGVLQLRSPLQQHARRPTSWPWSQVDYHTCGQEGSPAECTLQ